MSLARDVLLAAIRGYKRHVSPRKGFSCAYRVHLGACSCSTLGLRAISRYGAWRGLGVLRLRLAHCRLVAEGFRARPFVARAAQAGFVDCDVPWDASCADASCIDASACSCGDWTPLDSACEVLACTDVDDCGDGCAWGGCDRWCGRKRPTEAAARRRRRRGDPVLREPGRGGPPAED